MSAAAKVPYSKVPPAVARRRDYAGPALFSYGFRPFFLGAALWSGAVILFWVAQYAGEIELHVPMNLLDWHAHELIYGYVAAVVAGFLLTAIPNWTGRLPVRGLPLAALAALWLAGRIAICFADQIGHVAAAAIDVAFLLAVAAVAAREIIAGKNWQNLRVLVAVSLLIAANIIWHAELLTRGSGDYGPRLAIAAVIVLITLIGGRIVPSFTRNWLVRMNPGRLPQPLGRFDMAAIAAGALALALWVALPAHEITGYALMAAGVIHLVRVARWAGDRTFADRLVLVLHVAYVFVPLGFLLLGASLIWPAEIAASAGIHAWTTGAIGLMTLAVMTRATLGHTGRPLVASGLTQAIYLAALVAAILRVCAALFQMPELIHVAGLAWALAFFGFAAVFGPILLLNQPVWGARSP